MYISQIFSGVIPLNPLLLRGILYTTEISVYSTICASDCRRPALVAPSLGVVGTSRSSVRIVRPTTTTDEDNLSSFSLKEMDERRTESGERLPLPAASGQRRTTSPTGASSVSTSGRRVSASSISFSDYLPNPLD